MNIFQKWQQKRSSKKQLDLLEFHKRQLMKAIGEISSQDTITRWYFERLYYLANLEQIAIVAPEYYDREYANAVAKGYIQEEPVIAVAYLPKGMKQ